MLGEFIMGLSITEKIKCYQCVGSSIDGEGDCFNNTITVSFKKFKCSLSHFLRQTIKTFSN